MLDNKNTTSIQTTTSEVKPTEGGEVKTIKTETTTFRSAGELSNAAKVALEKPEKQEVKQKPAAPAHAKHEIADAKKWEPSAPPRSDFRVSQKTEQRSGLLSNVLAIIGFVILIVIVIWGLTHLASISRSWFGSFFSGGSANAIQVIVPTGNIPSGQPITISWKYTPPTKGAYAFFYQCKSGFQFQTPGPTGLYNGIPCGASYAVGASGNSVTVAPILTGSTSPLVVPLSIIFTPTATSTGSGQAAQQAQGGASITVVSSVAAGATPLPEPSMTYTPPAKETPAPAHSAPAKKTYSGPADLSVRILTVGVVDASGRFVTRNPVSPNEVVAVLFDIKNVGGSPTGTWYFSAQLPTQGGYTYASPAQASLAPGDHIGNTLRFTDGMPGGIVTIYANASSDSDSANDVASVQLGSNFPSAQGYGGTQYNYAPAAYGNSYNAYGGYGGTQYNYNAYGGYNNFNPNVYPYQNEPYAPYPYPQQYQYQTYQY